MQVRKSSHSGILIVCFFSGVGDISGKSNTIIEDGLLQHRALVSKSSAPLSQNSARPEILTIYFIWEIPKGGTLLFLILSVEEQAIEIQWARRRPKSKVHGAAGEAFDVGDDNVWRKVLTAEELSNLSVYESTSEAGCTFQLNQTVKKDRGAKSSPHTLKTVIRNCGIEWLSDMGRWKATSELLCSQGFPGAAELGEHFWPAMQLLLI